MNLRFTTTSYGSKVDFDEFFSCSGDDTTIQHFDGPLTSDDAFLDIGYNQKFGSKALTPLFQLDACMQYISCSSADQVYLMQAQHSGNAWRESKGTKLSYKNLSPKYGTVSVKPPTDILFKKFIVYSESLPSMAPIRSRQFSFSPTWPRPSHPRQQCWSKRYTPAKNKNIYQQEWSLRSSRRAPNPIATFLLFLVSFALKKTSWSALSDSSLIF